MATIEGTLTDGDGDGVEGATVTITEVGSGTLEAETTTDASGFYSASVAADSYDVRAEKFSYDPTEETDQSVGTGETRTVDLSTTRVDHKVRGRFDDPTGIAVLGTNTAGSATAIGVLGSVPNADGYGLATTDDARVEGALDTTGEWQVTVDGGRALLLGGSGTYAGNVVHGHPANGVVDDAPSATIGGGGYRLLVTGNENVVYDDFGTVAGGKANRAGSPDGDRTTATHATVGGGSNNQARGGFATIAGGEGNLIDPPDGDGTPFHATVSGGQSNVAKTSRATIGGGMNNRVGGVYSTIGGGRDNEAHGRWSTIGGGFDNRTGRSGTAKANHATVPGGTNNLALADNSFAAGRNARARDEGAFVWADSDASKFFASDQTGTSGSPTGADTFHARATGGVRFVTATDGAGDPVAGAYLDAGGSSWKTVSAKSAKHDVRPVDPESVLDGVDSLTVSRWAYDANPGVDRMGPMAGEFSEAFGLGDDSETIGHVDADGVALAAIQGLSDRLDDRSRALREELAGRDQRIDAQRERIDALERENDRKDERIDAQRERIDDLEAENDALRDRLTAVEGHLDLDDPPEAPTRGGD